MSSTEDGSDRPLSSKRCSNCSSSSSMQSLAEEKATDVPVPSQPPQVLVDEELSQEALTLINALSAMLDIDDWVNEIHAQDPPENANGEHISDQEGDQNNISDKYLGNFRDYLQDAESDKWFSELGFEPKQEEENSVAEEEEEAKVSIEKTPTKAKSNPDLDSSAPSIKESLPRKVLSDSTVVNVNYTRKQIDFALIRSESRMALQQSLSQVLKPGITGLKMFMSSSRQLPTSKGESRATVLDFDQPHLSKFIDYFIDCDGLRYLGILEQIELDYEDRLKATLLGARTHTQTEAEYLRMKLSALTEVELEYQPKGLKEVDFPELLAAEIKILPINYKPKMVAIRRIHEYGLDMEKYWAKELEEGRKVDSVEVYDIGTQMLAELMGQVFSLLVKSCEFLMQVNEDIKKYRDKYTSFVLMKLFSEFRRLLVDEVGAVGETCGGIMIKIPYMTDDDIIDIMTKLYSQVSFVDICICKALRAVIPLIMLYELNRQT